MTIKRVFVTFFASQSFYFQIIRNNKFKQNIIISQFKQLFIRIEKGQSLGYYSDPLSWNNAGLSESLPLFLLPNIRYLLSILIFLYLDFIQKDELISFDKTMGLLCDYAPALEICAFNSLYLCGTLNLSIGYTVSLYTCYSIAVHVTQSFIIYLNEVSIKLSIYHIKYFLSQWILCAIMTQISKTG